MSKQLPTLVIRPLDPIRCGGYLRYGVSVEGLPSADPKTLWCEIPAAYERKQPQRLDPFVVGTLFLAMRYADKLHVHGSVAPSLLKNLGWFQTTWTQWFPNAYHRVDITADDVSEPTLGERQGAVAAFSGGVDSCFTLYQHHHRRHERDNHPPQAALMVHGFDIPIEDRDVFDRAVVGSRRIVESLGLPLLTAHTNFRQIVPAWEQSHGAALVMALMLFDEHFDVALLASSWTFNEQGVRPWGSNVMTDKLLGSQSFGVIHDGSRYNRWDKMGALVQWQAFRDNLRVCWEGEQKDRNCCRCEKCVRNILLLRALGCRNLKCFPLELSDDALRRMNGLSKKDVETLEIAWHQIRDAGVTESWVDTLAETIARNRRQNRGIRRYGRLVYKGWQHFRSHGIQRTIGPVWHRLSRVG
ncbi:hypothetical protein ACERK3_07845 [Phycisphaerales bacterium AB-hyl4]|uniref:7-cyano-7-deazaguanine synthase n=1 Tax=Natronomicrosphaera hydrolytica TaxID=3242702 RepID=A0ABV4U4F5_9BACT